MLYPGFVFPSCLLTFVAILSPTHAQRAIQLEIKADWPTHAADKIAEYSEFVSDYSPNMFWTYITKYCNITKLHAQSDDPIQFFAAEVARQVLPESLYNMMDTSVGLGTYAPTVRFYTTLSTDFGNPCNSEAFVVTYPGEIVHCYNNQSKSLVLSYQDDDGQIDISSAAGASSWDHVYPSPSGAGNNNHHAVLYGVIGTTTFCNLYDELLPGAIDGSYRYSVRHAFPASGVNDDGATRVLQGYGVHLDIKNMEYKNLDDSKTSHSDGDEDASSLPNEDIKVSTYY